MFKIYFTAILLLFGLPISASAATPPNVIAQKVVTEGFIKQPPHGIRILRDGSVTSFSAKGTYVIGMIYLSSKDELISVIEKSTSKPEDTDPQGPFCMDMPRTDYSAFRESGEEVVVAKKMRCHTYLSQDLVTVKNILDSFDALDKTLKTR